MSDPRARGSAARAWLAVLALAACAAGGFLAYRALNPPSTLHALPPAAASGAAAPHAPPASGEGPAASPAPAAPARQIPEVLPEIALPGLDGASHRLADWQGRPLLVNFWATWCEPCRREIPLLKRLRRERGRERLEVLGIAIDFREAAQKYARDRGIDYPVLVGEQGGYEAVAAFGMDAVLPFSAFADSHGRIVALKVGELHGDEADYILDRIRDVDRGDLPLSSAREQIAAHLRTLSAARQAPPDAAAH